MIDKLKKRPRVKVTKDGPYLVSGGVPVVRECSVLGADGEPVAWQRGPSYPVRESCGLCRCGQSENQPFCDGSHAAAGFDGTENGGRRPYLDDAEKTVGQTVDLTWSAEFCAVARFCHGGEEAWGYAERSDAPEARRTAIKQASNCPAGSLVAWDKAGTAIEPALEPSISVTENPPGSAEGPLWVKGGILIESADGFEYETRNRVTLCRCGRSSKKPFCDGSHLKS